MPFYKPMRECFVGYNLHPCYSFRETYVLHDVLPIFMPHLHVEQPFTKRQCLPSLIFSHLATVLHPKQHTLTWVNDRIVNTHALTV